MPGLPNPYVILGALAGMLLMCAAAFGYGVHVTNDHWNAKELGVEKQIEAEKDALVKQANDAEAALSAAQAQQKVVYRDVIKNVDRIVTRPVYRNVCLDPDGLQLANTALTGKTPNSSQSNGTVPGPHTP